MASKFSELVVDSVDPISIARWWAKVLDYEVTHDEDDTVEISGSIGAGPTLLFVKVPEEKTVKNRIHIDVSPTDRTQNEELDRLLQLGAKHSDVGQGDEASWVVLTDPEGNEFCLLRTQREPWPT